MAWHPFRNLRLKVFALALGAALWFTVSGPQAERTVPRVPVTYRNVPAGLEITAQTEAVDVQIRGLAREIGAIQPDQIHVDFDLAGQPAGSLTLPLATGQIRAPMGVAVTQVYPVSVSITLEPAEAGERTVGLVAVATRNLAPGRQARVDPDTVAVAVRGSRAALARMDPASLMASVDLGGLAPGRHQLPVRVSIGGALSVTAVKPATVTVVIR
jgi:YbbR domain-containing protein